MPRRIVKYFEVVFVIGLWAAIAYAQISQATLQGTIKDKSGAVVPGATVALQNKGTGAARSVTSDSAGEYFIPNLDPTEYSVTVTFQGFKTFVISSFILHTGDHATLDGTLELGESSQEITVGAAVPLLTTASAEVSHLVPPSQVAELPLNGRNFWELTQLTPGATFLPVSQTASFNGSELRALAVNVTINGGGYMFTGWSLDGANINNLEKGGTLIVPNVDAIQEFAVISGNMPAEFGHMPNMVVSSLKSGTNSFHGTAFDYLRNSDLDARNFFLASREPLKRNQFGGTLGGPIKKDKVFFFADYQGTRLRQGSPFNDTVPSVMERSGNFSDLLPKAVNDPLNSYTPFPGNIIPANRISSQGAFFVPYLPMPNLIVGTTSHYTFAPSLPLGRNYGDARVDAPLTAKDSYMARYSVTSSYETNPNPEPTLPSADMHSKAQDSTVRWTHILNPVLLNVAQIAYYDSPFIFGAIGPGDNIDGSAGIQGFSDQTITPQQSWPLISMSGYQSFTGSPSDQRPKYLRERSLQLNDSINYTHGKHEMKFGMEWMYQRSTVVSGQSDVGNFSFTGAYSGNGFGDLLLGVPYSVVRSATETAVILSDNFKAWHFSDTYRVKPGLTLTLGARWEINPFFTANDHQRMGFDFRTGKVIVPSGIQSTPQAQPLTSQMLGLFSDRIEYTNDLGLPQSVAPSDHRDISPRVGIAWSPFGSSKTVIRSAYGIFYAFPDSNMGINTIFAPPFIVTQTVINTPSPAAPSLTFGNFFQGQPIVSGNPNPGQPCPWGAVMLSCATPSVGEGALAHLRQQYTQEWNLSIQRELTSRIAVTAAYVGNRTNRLEMLGSQWNDPQPGPGTVQARRPYPQWGPIALGEWGGKATYEGLQTSLDVRDWHGLTLMAAYVHSKCLDTGTDQSAAPAEALNGLNYAPCNQDQANTGSVSFNYGLPFGKGKHFLNTAGVVNQILGGWQLATVLSMKSGLPFTPTVSTDRANTGDSSERPNVIGKPFMPHNVNCWFYTSANSSCTALYSNQQSAFAVPAQYTFGTGGRNILRGDNLTQVDFSILKEFPLSEAKRLEFRAELFNIFNHPAFSNPSTNIDVSSGGQVSSTLNSDRIVEFALKLHF